jgi:sec-independent protein translocase protein TatA
MADDGDPHANIRRRRLGMRVGTRESAVCAVERRDRGASGALRDGHRAASAVVHYCERKPQLAQFEPEAAMRLGWQELVIVLVIVVIVFGGARLAGLGKSAGRAIREFKEEVGADDGAAAKAAEVAEPAAPSDSA